MTNSEAPTKATDEPCDVCGHPWSAHDVLGERFCAATKALSLSRGCICRLATDRPAARGTYRRT